MANTAAVKDNHLYITHDYYDYGHQEGRKIIPLEDIECIKAKVGPQGGMHLWSIRGYDPRYSDQSYNKGKERDIEIFTGDRKNRELIDKILEVLPDLKYFETTESGGAGW